MHMATWHDFVTILQRLCVSYPMRKNSTAIANVRGATCKHSTQALQHLYNTSNWNHETYETHTMDIHTICHKFSTQEEKSRQQTNLRGTPPITPPIDDVTQKEPTFQ